METEDKDVSQYPRYWLPDAAYNVLKWVGLAALPAASWAYQFFGNIWGAPCVGEVSMTLAGAGVLVAVLIGASQLSALEGVGSDDA